MARANKNRATITSMAENVKKKKGRLKPPVGRRIKETPPGDDTIDNVFNPHDSKHNRGRKGGVIIIISRGNKKRKKK